MNYAILFFGALITLGGAILIIRPNYIFSIFRQYGDSLTLHFFAVIIRILFGVSLIMGALESKYPIVLHISGWLLLSVALVLAVMGQERFKSMMKWSVELSPLVQRLGAVLGILFGSFLIYAVA